MPDTTWTTVTRDRGGRFYRPVTGAPTGTQQDAQRAANRLATTVDTMVRIRVTRTDATTVIEHDGKATPIRWDATPKHTHPAPADAPKPEQAAPAPCMRRVFAAPAAWDATVDRQWLTPRPPATAQQRAPAPPLTVRLGVVRLLGGRG